MALLVPEEWCIQREVSLYRGLCAQVVRAAEGWVTSMQAAAAGPPAAHGTAAPGVMLLACCMAAWACWCSRGRWWCTGRWWHSHPALCLGSSEEQERVLDQLGKAAVARLLQRDAGCGGEAWGRAQMCFEAIRQAETWVRAGKVGH